MPTHPRRSLILIVGTLALAGWWLLVNRPPLAMAASGSTSRLSIAAETARSRLVASVAFQAGGATASSPITFAYRSANLAGSERVVLQRSEGTAHHWTTVAALKADSQGTSQLAGLPLGQYLFRIAVLGRHGLVVSQRQWLRVFGNVPFAQIGGGEHRGTLALATTTFDYVLTFEAPGTGFSTSRTTCRSVSLRFAATVISGVSNGEPVSFKFSVVQADLEPTGVAGGEREPIELNATLIPGTSWAINVQKLTGGFHLDEIYVNGSASCYTLTGS
jgi:hypothetical protein